MGPQHDVKVKLQIGAETAQASKAVQDLERQTRRLDKASQDANREMRKLTSGGGMPGSPTGPASTPQADGGSIGISSFAATLTKVTIAASMAARALEGLGKAASNNLYRSDFSTGQKAVGFTGDLLNSMLGGVPGRISDSLYELYYSKSAAGAQKQLGNESRDIAIENVRAQRDRRLADMTREQAFAVNGFAGDRAARDINRVVDRVDVFGMRAAPIRDANRGVVNAEMEAQRARAAMRAIDEEVRRKANDLDGGNADRPSPLSLKGREEAQRQRVNAANGNEFQYEKERSKLRERQNEVMQAQADLQALIEKRQKAGLDVAQKELELAKRKNEVSKVELEILKDRAKTAAANEESFGMMSAGDKLGTLFALQQAKSRGFNSLTEEQRGLLARNQVTSEFARNQAAAEAAKDPILGQTLQLLGQDRAEDLRNKVIKLQEELKVQVDVDENAFAASATKALSESFEKLRGIIADIARQQIQMMMTQSRQVNP